MKKAALVFGVIFVFAQMGQAGMAPSCVSGTLASYIALGTNGCLIGNDQLTGFQTLTTAIPGASLISPANVLVTPSGSTANPSLMFDVSATAATNQVVESFFTYQITGGVSGSMITLSNTNATGDGVATYIQDLCSGGVFGPSGISGCTGTANQLVLAGNGSDQTALPTSASLSVTDDFALDGGTSGTATGGTFTDQFSTSGPSAVPEPGTIFAAGFGLAVVAVLKRRAILNLIGLEREAQ